MKKITMSLFALLLIVPLSATNIKVRLNSNMQEREFTFFRNYAIVINKDHYYGPIKKEVPLKIEAIGDKYLSLYLEYFDEETKSYKDNPLGKTTSRVDIVHYLGDGVDFSETIDETVKGQKSKTIAFTDQMLSKQINKYKDPFFEFMYKETDEVKLKYKINKEIKKEGTVEFSGIPSFFALSNGSKNFYVVENINLEKYLFFVTNCEIIGAETTQAYKAQAVLARTFALKKIDERNAQFKNHNKTFWRNFQLEADTRDQAYICNQSVKEAKEYSKPSDSLKNSVLDTTDKVLGKNGKLIEIHYCAYCGECSYCTKNHCEATKNGLGDCQHGIIDYAKNHNYIETLAHFHEDASLYKYDNGDLKLIQPLNNKKAELENHLIEAQDRLQQMI